MEVYKNDFFYRSYIREPLAISVIFADDMIFSNVSRLRKETGRTRHMNKKLKYSKITKRNIVAKRKLNEKIWVSVIYIYS